MSNRPVSVIRNVLLFLILLFALECLLHGLVHAAFFIGTIALVIAGGAWAISEPTASVTAAASSALLLAIGTLADGFSRHGKAAVAIICCDLLVIGLVFWPHKDNRRTASKLPTLK